MFKVAGYVFCTSCVCSGVAYSLPYVDKHLEDDHNNSWRAKEKYVSFLTPEKEKIRKQVLYSPLMILEATGMTFKNLASLGFAVLGNPDELEEIRDKYENLDKFFSGNFKKE